MRALPLWPMAALLCVTMSACSEARSDIENLDADELTAEAEELTDTANAATEAQVAKIQSFEVEPQAESLNQDENIEDNQ